MEWENNQLSLGDCPSLFYVDGSGTVYYDEDVDYMGNPSKRDTIDWSTDWYAVPMPSYNMSTSKFKVRDCPFQDVQYTVLMSSFNI